MCSLTLCSAQFIAHVQLFILLRSFRLPSKICVIPYDSVAILLIKLFKAISKFCWTKTIIEHSRRIYGDALKPLFSAASIAIIVDSVLFVIYYFHVNVCQESGIYSRHQNATFPSVNYNSTVTIENLSLLQQFSENRMVFFQIIFVI